MSVPEVATWKVGARTFNAYDLMRRTWALVNGNGPIAHSMVAIWLAGTPRAMPDLLRLNADAYAAKYGTTGRRALITLLAGVAAADGLASIDAN